MGDFKRIEKNNMVFYKSEILEECDFFEHLFTTRVGGVSDGENYSLNLGINKEDTKNVIENFGRVCALLETDLNDLFVLKQIHTDKVHIYKKGDISPVYNTDDRVCADGIISNEKGSCFGVFYADCVPVILADNEKKVVAAVHSGWRSTALHIAKKAAEKMIEVYGCKPKDIRAAMGPSIRECCFEVDSDAAEMFDLKYRRRRNGKFVIDLQRVIKEDLMSLGVCMENIKDSGICTKCNSDEFFSSRAQKGKHGLMMALAAINH